MEIEEGFEPVSEEMENGGRAGQTECTFSFVALFFCSPFSLAGWGKGDRGPHCGGWILRGWMLDGDGNGKTVKQATTL